MTDMIKLRETASYNERSLKTLVRSIAMSQQQFSLILVRCNYEHLRQQMVKRLHSHNNLLTILIFDQFEEFFFVSTSVAQRQQFYKFLRLFLNLPFVKVILCMREDYLHYLLECDRFPNLDAINNNILDKSIRYQLRSFSIKDARAAIGHLTERAEFYLEPELINAFVEDLSDELQEIRPSA
ncbi:MAG: hypothetical protein P2A85_09980 [Microcoleus anatoxicus]|uniref:nSTAND1 domain-containing NTPase n=1 Tax=Microcoleus anatoxicus TaxID=2705319 RepID=UPI00367010F8